MDSGNIKGGSFEPPTRILKLTPDFSDFKEEVYDYDRTTYGVIDCAVNQISSEEMFKFIKSNKLFHNCSTIKSSN